MKFEKFQSLLNENPKEMSWLMAQPELMNAIWVMTEKLHGANYSIDISADKVVRGKRTSLLDEGANFFNDQRFMTPEYTQQLQERAAGLFDNFKTIRVRGEIFGGDIVEGIKAVQKEVRYESDISFRAFAIDVELPDGSVAPLAWPTVCHVCATLGIQVVPVLAIGKFSELYAQFQEQPTTIGNSGDIMEGVVLRCDDEEGQRVMFVKRRNKEFLEKKSVKVAGGPDKYAEYANLLPTVGKVREYLTVQRVSNVCSHEGWNSFKEFGLIAKAVWEDAVAEYLRDTGVNLAALDDAKVIKKMCSTPLTKAIKDFLNA